MSKLTCADITRQPSGVRIGALQRVIGQRQSGDAAGHRAQVVNAVHKQVPRLGSQSNVGFKPQTPHSDAGTRIKPFVSEPKVNGP